ncbi:methylmalonyl-CoA mutase family protein [Vibrio diazotrophicus]|uniref:methylmalonyl-CoA mutase family protein n=1 Tax=Vibrio diazotrophicus TaxID=685 RepID=UPI00142D2E6A|nr:methylmalonyl-CoA mutase family protein [Vibrio diazotrophicus]NIY92032.1 methylmalonyl-CoA mutase [Vibrio diazotrophicus]
MDDSNLKFKGFYQELTDESYSWLDNSGMPPFVRGIHESMYLKKKWTIRQYSGFNSAEETNHHFKNMLQKGQTGLSVAFDLPTHLGFDSSSLNAKGEVGKTGVAIDTVEDMKVLFSGIDLSEVSVSMTMNGAVLPILCCYIVTAEEMGVSPQALNGTIQNDILKEFAVRNTYIESPEKSMRIVGDIVEYCQQNMPKYNSMSISGYHFQEAGASPELELALTLMNAREYLNEFSQRGINVELVAKRLSFFFCLGMDFFKEIAKLRAARYLWNELLLSHGIEDTAVRKMKIHCQTSGVSLTEESPLNNIVRTTIEAMAGVFGGTQSLHTNSFDEAISLPSQAAAEVALNTQKILQQETGIADVVDPWGGSYMMETATTDMITYVQKLMSELSAQGTMTELCANGTISNLIHQHAVQSEVNRRSPSLVSSEQQNSVSTLTQPSPTGDELWRSQQRKLSVIKLKRNSVRVEQALMNIKFAVRHQQNLMEPVLEAVRARATIQECTDAILNGEPRYRKEDEICSGYLSSFNTDQVREQVVGLTHQLGRQPRILISKAGMDGHDRGAKLVASLFIDIGFDVDYLPVFTTTEEIKDKLMTRQYDVFGLSILSNSHFTFVDELANFIPENTLWLLGGIIPESDKKALTEQGVDLVFTPKDELGEMIIKVLKVMERMGSDVRCIINSCRTDRQFKIIR